MPSASICRSRRTRAAVALAGVLASVLAPRPRAQETFRSAADLVALQVSVADPQQRLVANLSAQDFGIFDEGQLQPVALFAAGTAPLDLMLLIDTSDSMYQRMDATQQAAINFVGALNADDRASVVLFSDRVRIAQALTGDGDALRGAIRGARAAGGTALHDALYVSLRELARTQRGADPGRRQAIVVLTDGDDTGSRLAFDDVLDEARRSAVTIFTIVPSTPPWEELLQMPVYRRPAAPFEMRQLAEETGGRAFAPTEIGELSGVYGSIAEELSSQYWIAFAPPPSAGGFRQVAVRVLTQPALRARTRAGYFARAPRGAAPVASHRSLP